MNVSGQSDESISLTRFILQGRSFSPCGNKKSFTLKDIVSKNEQSLSVGIKNITLYYYMELG